MDKNMEYINQRMDLVIKIKEKIIQGLDLEIEIDELSDDQPLIGRGLEIDSIDLMEISLLLSEEFDLELDDETTHIFGSINRIADYIEENNDEYRRDS